MDIYISYIQPLLTLVTIVSLMWLAFNILVKSKITSENFYKFFAVSLIIQFIAMLFFGASGIILFVITIGIILFYTEGFDKKFVERFSRD